jgi:hypothetical protein
MSERNYYYWYKNIRYRPEDRYPPLDAMQFGLPMPGAVFCFFTSEEYAQRWLEQQMARVESALPGGEPADWILDGTGDVNRLLAVCDEAAGLAGRAHKEGFFTPTPFQGFLINPPLNLMEAPVPMDVEQVKDALQRQQASDG